MNMADSWGDSLNIGGGEPWLEEPSTYAIKSPTSSSGISGSLDFFTSARTSSKNVASHRTNVEEMGNSGLWVFGYGSLCWHQGFEFSDSRSGFVAGFSRRFWQGNITHRGTNGKPGRVATLVEDSEGIVWGQAFKVSGESALPYLNNRECNLGGYRTSLATFTPRSSSTPPFPVMLYIATPSSSHWLGDSPLPAIAEQILSSAGDSGHNVEYLLRLAGFVRETFPEAKDDHLFGLEALVLDGVIERNLCLKTLMGESSVKGQPADQQVQEIQPSSSSQFSSRVPSKHLRCVNI